MFFFTVKLNENKITRITLTKVKQIFKLLTTIQQTHSRIRNVVLNTVNVKSIIRYYTEYNLNSFLIKPDRTK